MFMMKNEGMNENNEGLINCNVLVCTEDANVEKRKTQF